MRFSETTKYLSNYLTFGRILSRLNKKCKHFFVFAAPKFGFLLAFSYLCKQNLELVQGLAL